MKQHIYADNAATTKLDTVAFEAMTPWLLEEYGNASQPYAFARKPKKGYRRGTGDHSGMYRCTARGNLFHLRWHRERQLGNQKLSFFQRR